MDRKRVFGPESSVVPLKFDSPTPNFSSSTRPDNRAFDEVRSLYLSTGIVNQANGSAFFESGNVKVVCAVYGPRQSSSRTFENKGTLNCDFKFAPFALPGKRRGYAKDDQEKDLSTQLTTAISPSIRLSQYPKSSIDIFVQVIESDGISACFSGAVNAATLALADAGIEMTDCVVAASVGIFKSGLRLDCTAEEEISQIGSVVLGYMPSLNEVTHILFNGEVSSSSLMEKISEQAVELGVDAASKIHSVVNDALIRSAQKSVQAVI
ncbi:hypothetical protein HK098_003529 [Nowakowskiella sp. JEL0407]|nr:hypothetical protein HK098_003529 [Nowakowskiella sp. JEL0407]